MKAVIVLAFLLAACAPRLAPEPGASGFAGDDGLTAGHRLMASGDYERALRAYYRGAAEQGANAEVLSAIGSANLKLGRLNQAEQVLRRAVEADQRSVPAWNNLGVALFERGKTGEAARVFETAYALDNGRSDEIRDNLRLAQSRMKPPEPGPQTQENFRLVRRGQGDYQLLTQPDA